MDIVDLKTNMLTLDEIDNTMDYLEKCAFFIQQTEDIRWKWVAITLRQALYNFCILAITGSNYDRVCKFDKKNKIFIPKLIDFPEAMRRIEMQKWMRQFVHSKTAVLTAEQRGNCEFLNNSLRNEFEHFIPRAWVIDLNRVRRIINSVLEVISFLVFESGNIFLGNDHRQKRVGDLIGIIKRAV